MSRSSVGSIVHFLGLGDLRISILLLLTAIFGLSDTLSGQSVCCGQSHQERTELRAGISVGGIGKLGLTLELRRDSRSINLNLATFTQNDLGMAVTLRQYFGNGTLQPFAGVGLWGAKQFSNDPEETSGTSFLARLPLGVDWRLPGPDHSIAGNVALNRAIYVKKSPSLITPNDNPRRIVPLPQFSYHYTLRNPPT
ncbi:MAG: hypothetical protein CME30_00305 [Gemmatimonadetes bacterium]|nr:hypothetical protein [Gemmatimonadota bacterium]